MVIAIGSTQEHRREERRKYVRALDSASKQIITATNSENPADAFMNDFLAESAKAMECSSALIVFREDAFLRSKYQYEMQGTLGKSWTNEDLPHAVKAGNDR